MKIQNYPNKISPDPDDELIISDSKDGEATKNISVYALGVGIGNIGDTHFTFVQGVPENTWVINHGMRKKPSVTVVDSSDTQVEGDIRYDSLDRLTISFNSAFSGKAYLN